MINKHHGGLKAGECTGESVDILYRRFKAHLVLNCSDVGALSRRVRRFGGEVASALATSLGDSGTSGTPTSAYLRYPTAASQASMAA